MKARNKRRLYRIKPKPKPRRKVLRCHPAYTVAELRKKKSSELVIIAKVLAVDYRVATGEKKVSLGTLIIFIAGLVEERSKENA